MGQRMTKAHQKHETNENQSVKKPYQSANTFLLKMGNQNNSAAFDHHQHHHHAKPVSPQLSTFANKNTNQASNLQKSTKMDHHKIDDK